MVLAWVEDGPRRVECVVGVGTGRASSDTEGCRISPELGTINTSPRSGCAVVENEDHLAGLLKAAAVASASVPESLREAAFQAAFAYLSGGGSAGARAAVPEAPAKRRRGRGAAVDVSTDGDRLAPLRSVDRSLHPDVTSELPVLERSLRILQIAEGVGLEDMTPPEIVTILREKFRVSTDRTSVSGSLGKSPLVDRVKQGSAYTYRLTDAGREIARQGCWEDNHPSGDSDIWSSRPEGLAREPDRSGVLP